MRFDVALIAVCMLVTSVAKGQVAPSDTDRAKKFLSAYLYPHAESIVRRELSTSGLASDDIDRAVQVVTNGFSSCVIEALASDSNPKSVKFVELLSQVESESELKQAWLKFDPSDDAGFVEVLTPVIRECNYTVMQEAGLGGM